MRVLLLIFLVCLSLSAQRPQSFTVESYDPSHEIVVRVWISSACPPLPVTAPCRISSAEANAWTHYKAQETVVSLQNRAVDETGAVAPAMLPAAVRARKEAIEQAEQADRDARRKAEPPAAAAKRDSKR